MEATQLHTLPSSSVVNWLILVVDTPLHWASWLIPWPGRWMECISAHMNWNAHFVGRIMKTWRQWSIAVPWFLITWKCSSFSSLFFLKVKYKTNVPKVSMKRRFSDDLHVFNAKRVRLSLILDLSSVDKEGNWRNSFMPNLFIYQSKSSSSSEDYESKNVFKFLMSCIIYCWSTKSENISDNLHALDWTNSSQIK